MNLIKNGNEKSKQLLLTMNNNINNMKDEIYKCNEKENELNILNNKIQSNINRYIIVMDEMHWN